MNLCFDAGGLLYTSESGMGRVKRYTSDGKFVDLVGYVGTDRFWNRSGLASSCSNIAIAATPDGERVYVMDPLAKQLACDCVAGYAQRDYGKLGKFLQRKLDRRVEIAYAETLSAAQVGARREVDLVIGKFSVVGSDARESKLPVRAIAMLSGKDGSITQTGLFVVRQSDPAKSVEDLEDYRILFGPEDSVEKRSAAFASLEAFDIPLPKPIRSKSSCSGAALAVVERDADAAVVSSYAMPLFDDVPETDRDVWSHPALVGNRFYVRNSLGVYCFLLQ